MDKMMAVRCTKCGSDEAGHDANASWDMARQEWALASTQDQHWCPNCGEVDHEFYELTGQELADAMHERRMCGPDELLASLRRLLKEDGPIAQLVIPGLIVEVQAIKAKLREYAATMAEQDELIDALALTLPYAESRAEDLAEAAGFGKEDKDAPGVDEAESVVGHAGRVLASYGKQSRLLERGQRAGGAA